MMWSACDRGSSEVSDVESEGAFGRSAISKSLDTASLRRGRSPPFSLSTIGQINSTFENTASCGPCEIEPRITLCELIQDIQ